MASLETSWFRKKLQITAASLSWYPNLLATQTTFEPWFANLTSGMSCAVFEIPKSPKVTIMGGSETTGWLTDNAGCDDHYSFRTIRTTVAVRQ